MDLENITTKNFSAFYNNTVIAGQSGAAGENELDQLLNMIFAQSETAKHIVRRLYMFFVYYKIDAGVESNVIEPLAQELISNNFEILPVLQTLFKSEHFYDMAHMSCHIKSPYDFAMGFIRELEAPMPANEPDLQMALHKLNLFTGQMGMELHNIQQVAGWIAYYQTPGFHENWINASTLSARIDFSKQFLNGLNYGGPSNLKLDILSFVSTFTNPSDPNALVQEACTRLYSYDISQNGRDFLKSFLLAGGPGADSYWVQATFDLSKQITVRKVLEEWGIENQEDILFLRRRVLKNGKSQNTINGMQVPLNMLSKIAAQLVDLTREQGRLTMADAVTLTGVNRNTLKQHFRKLVEDGHLELHGRARGAWYSIR